MKRTITIEVEEDDLKKYATFSRASLKGLSPIWTAIADEAKRLYPQYETGAWYRVTFGGENPQVLFRVGNGWAYRNHGDNRVVYPDAGYVPTEAVRMVEAE